MVKGYVENGKFKFKGTFDFGYIGLFKDDQIGVCCDCSDVKDEWCDELSKKLDIDNCTAEEIAAFLTERMNDAEKIIQKNVQKVNDSFLECVYYGMEGCGREFWEREELRIPGFDYDDPDFYFYAFPEDGTNNDYEHLGLKRPPEGSYRSEDGFEAYLRTYKPMFNLDNLIRGIKPEYVCLHNDSISFQCSDIYDYALLCAAYDMVDLNDLSFTDWHNY